MPKGRHARNAESQDQAFARACSLADRGRSRQAFKLFLRLAQTGDESSQLNVGVAYDAGRGVRRSRSRALYWYRKGVRRKDFASASNIGTIYRDEGRPLLALRWFKKALAWGDADALLEIAKLYLGPWGDSMRAKRALVRLRRLGHRTTEATQEEAADLLVRLKSTR